MNNKQLAKEIKSVTRQGDYETQLEAIENLLNKHRPEQLHKHSVGRRFFCANDELKPKRCSDQCAECLDMQEAF